MRISLSSVILAVGLPCLASTAWAQDEIPDDPEAGEVGGAEVGGDASFSGGTNGAGGPEKPISVALLLGYGITLNDDDTGGLNPFGLGFGVRGGYNLEQIYLGARFLYYLGDSEDVPTGFGGSVDFSFNVWELGIEGGYDLNVSSVVIRPALSLGLASLNADPGDSETEFFLAPGASALLDVAQDIFVGAEARLMFVLSDPGITALTLLATGGMRF